MIATAYKKEEKLYRIYSGPHHLSTIPVKDSHLFKIAESVFNFYSLYYVIYWYSIILLFYYVCIREKKKKRKKKV